MVVMQGETRESFGVTSGWFSYVPTLLVLVAVVIIGLVGGRQHTLIETQKERDRVATRLEALGGRIESNLNTPIQSARGVVAALASEPDMSQRRFSWLVSRIIGSSREIRNVAAARDLVVNLVYPVKGNESALGLDYRLQEAQREAAFHARDTGEFILTGPVDLVQGGQAFIGRIPVFSGTEGSHQFWGILSVVIDLPTLYETSGLSDEDPALEIGIVAANKTTGAERQFYGSADLLGDDPVSADVLFPNGSWRMYARPIDGWGSTVSLSAYRILLVTGGLAAVFLAAMANVMFVQRQHTIQVLRSRERDLEQARQEVESLALHDHLTGLPNRRHLDRKFRGMAGRNHPGLILLDLDGFKDVNDTHGHAKGDALLVEVARRLSKALRAGDFLARIGGDEFVVICGPSPQEDLTPERSKAILKEVAQRLIGCAQYPFRIGETECRIGISTGIHQILDENDDAPDYWLSQADRAMYAAKQAGRNRFAFSTPQPNRASLRGNRTGELLEALSGDQIQPYYQPQFGPDGRSVVGVEALARWIHPRDGLINPQEFMDQAHALKVESEIDRLVLARAITDLLRWERAGLTVPRVSVNTSFRSLGDPHLISAVDAVDVDPDRFTFEVLESIFIDDGQLILSRNVEALKARGFRIEVDDFGTGHSSVTSLLKLRPHGLKIDKMLVQAAPSSQQNRQLLAAIAEMGHAMKITVCAEGIETESQLFTARSVGCTRFQGFLLAHPMSADDFEFFLQGDRAKAG